MAELYIGNNQIGGGTPDLSGYVDVSTFDDVTHTTAAALVNLKILHNEQSNDILYLRTYNTNIATDISTLFSVKADASNYYTKKQIDDDGKVVAAALASIDQRVSSIESSVGDGSGSGGGEVDLSSLNSSVNLIENDYVKSDDISTFITSSYTYDKAHIDASISALSNSSGGGSSVNLTNYLYISGNALKANGGSSSDRTISAIEVADMYAETITTNGVVIGREQSGYMYIVNSDGDMYQIDLDQICSNFGTLIQ